MELQTNTNYPDRITSMFVGKTLLITGGSGFIGKVFLEKIIRECPDIKCVYLLLRPKKGKDSLSRLTDIFSSQLFDKLKSLRGSDILQKKCKAIASDMGEINLGLSQADRKILTENVNYIYHIAASVKFDEPLKSSVLMNSRGTKYMLDLAKECKKLEIFCYVSTAYAHPNEEIVDEKVYPPIADPYETIKVVEYLQEDMLDSITDKIMKGLPNTYTFSKSLSEGIVVAEMDNLPIIICRPSIVLPVYEEPLPGWTDNINGPVGILIGAGKGVIRSMYCNMSCYVDFIPVDVVANGLAVATWDYLTQKERRIFNFTSSDEFRYTWEELLDIGRKIVTEQVPFNGVPWYPGGNIKSTRFIHYMAVFFFQLIPSFLVDILLFCLGYKPILCRIQRRIINGYNMLEYYANNQWTFIKENSQKGRNNMNPREKEIYKVVSSDFNVESYFRDIILGARRYILRESDETLPAAKRHIKIMWCVDKVFKLLFLIGVLYFFYYYILIKFFTKNPV